MRLLSSVVLLTAWLGGYSLCAQGLADVKSGEDKCPTYEEVLQDSYSTFKKEFVTEIFKTEFSNARDKSDKNRCKKPSDLHPSQVPGSIHDALLHMLFPLPLSYSNNELHSYPGLFNKVTGKATCPSGACCEIPDPIKRKGVPEKVLKFGRSVGRLALVPKNYQIDNKRYGQTDSSQAYSYTQPYFWGSAFAIAPGVIATSCHQLESLIIKDGNSWKLNQDGEQRLIIDFGWQSNKYRKASEWDIKPQFFWSHDIDVALLLLKPHERTPEFPEKLPLYNGPEEPLYCDNHFLALLGHADLNHFIDSKAERVYRVFEEDADSNAPEDDEFTILDHLLKLPACGKRNKDYYLHWASTTTGESGSILMDLQPYPEGTDIFNVVAMHICCSDYFPQPKGNPPDSEPPCARLNRTFYNQAVPSWEILNDPKLCKVLHDYHGLPSGFQCPEKDSSQ